MTGGPCATQGFGRLAVRPAQACAETSSRGIVPERSGSTHQVCGQFRDAVAECVATTRRRCPQGAIFSGPPEKTHQPFLLPAGESSRAARRRLTRRQEKRLVRILLRGALANGYRTEVWTTKRVAEVIEKTFHVPCHYNTAGKLLHRLDWTPQKPERRALERDEQAIHRWKKKVWPRVKKTPRGWVLT